MEPSPKFWDKIAKKYSKQPIADEAAYQKKLTVTREYLRPDMQVLELGCGTGSTALLHAPFVRHIQATDISGNMIEIAREKAIAQNIKNVTFEQITVEDFQAADGSFDAIFAMSLLHLLADKEAAMEKIRRMLKPGGVFISSTACVGETMGFFKIIAPIGKFFGLLPLVKVFTQQELMESMTKAGFSIEFQWSPEKSQSTFLVAKKPL